MPPGLLFDGFGPQPSEVDGTPGYSDDVDDSFPTLLERLMYVSRDVIMSSHPAFDGVVVVGNSLTGRNALSPVYDSGFLESPPPAFSAGGAMRAVKGSWRWETLP